MTRATQPVTEEMSMLVLYMLYAELIDERREEEGAGRRYNEL
jgi:hypothetical protein